MPPQIYTLSLHDALPILRSARDTSDWETIEQSFPAHELVNIDIESTNAKVEILPTTDEDITVSYSNEKDRKSTRLNSSHVAISYAVFCLKKKKTKTENSQ